jgi:hypothetical protein
VGNGLAGGLIAAAVVLIAAGCAGDPDAEREEAVEQLCATLAEGDWRDLPDLRLKGVPADIVRSSDHVDRDWLLEASGDRCPEEASDYLAAVGTLDTQRARQDEQRKAKLEAERQAATRRSARQRAANERAADRPPSRAAGEGEDLFVGFLQSRSALFASVDRNTLLLLGRNSCDLIDAARDLEGAAAALYSLSETFEVPFTPSEAADVIVSANSNLC